MFFICVFTIRLCSAVPKGRPRLGARRTRAPSTITQYEYYSPLSPDDVRKIAGTPPRIVFLHTGFPGVGISWCVFEHHTFRVLFFYTQDSRETLFHICFYNPIAFGRSEGAPSPRRQPHSAPSTITQYEYYSPLSPDGVPKMFGTPPRIVFYTHRISGKRHVIVCF